MLESLTGSGLQSTFHPTFLAKPGIWITAAVVLLVLVGGACGRAAASAPGPRVEGRVRVQACGRARAGPASAAVAEPLAGWGAVLVLCWAIVPPALVFVYSFVSQPLFQPRNLVTSVPAIAFVVALAICDRRLPRAVAGVALVLALGIRLVPLALSYDVSPEPWDAATHAVLTAARPGDCVVFYPEDGHNPFQYYERTARPAGAVAPRSMLPITGWGEVRSYVERYETLSPAASGGAGLQLPAPVAGLQPRGPEHRPGALAPQPERVRPLPHPTRASVRQGPDQDVRVRLGDSRPADARERPH